MITSHTPVVIARTTIESNGQAITAKPGLTGAQEDTFTITVSDGQHNIPVTITNIPVSPTQLTVIDTNPATPAVDHITVRPSPIGVAFSPDGSLAYVTSSSGVSVIDTATHTVIDLNPATPVVDNIPVGGQPWGVAFSPVGSFAYVTNQNSNTVRVISLVPTTPPSVLA